MSSASGWWTLAGKRNTHSADPNQVEKRTRDGEKEIADHHQCLPAIANGQKIADLYHGRWKM